MSEICFESRSCDHRCSRIEFAGNVAGSAYGVCKDCIHSQKIGTMKDGQIVLDEGIEKYEGIGGITLYRIRKARA